MLAKSLPRRARSSHRLAAASAEIHAYIAARDLALAEAERQSSTLTLNRAFLANQLVESCLKPIRSPYQAQSLPEAEAVRERKRCGTITARLSQLRAGTGAGHILSSVAA